MNFKGLTALVCIIIIKTLSFRPEDSSIICIQFRAVASGPAGQAMAGPVLIKYVDTHAQMQQLSAMVLLRVESRLNILHSCLDLLAG